MRRSFTWTLCRLYGQFYRHPLRIYLRTGSPISAILGLLKNVSDLDCMHNSTYLPLCIHIILWHSDIVCWHETLLTATISDCMAKCKDPYLPPYTVVKIVPQTCLLQNSYNHMRSTAVPLQFLSRRQIPGVLLCFVLLKCETVEALPYFNSIKNFAADGFVVLWKSKRSGCTLYSARQTLFFTVVQIFIFALMTEWSYGK